MEKKRTLDEHSRALIVLPRTLEVLDGYGAAQDFLQEGVLLKELALHDVELRKPVLRLTFDDLDTETPFGGMLVLAQDPGGAHSAGACSA